MDARVPTQTLGFLRSKAFLIYISNVYDNLPTDEIVRIGGQTYLVEVRAYIDGAESRQIAESLGVVPEELPALTRRLLQLGPELLSQAMTDRFPGGINDAVAFWQRVWDATRVEERYVAFESGLDTYQIANGVRGEALRPILNAIGDVRMQVSNGAAAPVRDPAVLRHLRHRRLCLRAQLPRPRQIRWVRRQLGQRLPAGRDRPPQRLRGELRQLPAPYGFEHHDAHGARPGVETA
jgi:hypothetical protein